MIYGYCAGVGFMHVFSCLGVVPVLFFVRKA